ATLYFFILTCRAPPTPPLFPYTTLFRSYQTKTGRLLAKPPPIPDKEKAEKVDALGNAIYERYVVVEAAKNWDAALSARASPTGRSEEHTSELQSLTNLVCRLLLEKKKKR